MCFPETFVKFSRTPFSQNTSGNGFWISQNFEEVNLMAVQGYSQNNLTKSHDVLMPLFTCSKLTIEKLEQGVRYVWS